MIMTTNGTVVVCFCNEEESMDEFVKESELSDGDDLGVEEELLDTEAGLNC